MSPTTPVNWYLEVPSLALAALTYLLIARLVLDVAFGTGGRNLVFRALRAVTSPFVGLVGAITPRVVPAVLVTASTLVWVLAARIVLVQAGAAMAIRRMMG
ncbi:MAG TPA: hypothetical protein VFA64_06140 [Hyphomicrobiaceae bacterium]|nr:hypothetical protein [Hyphomicrobiaceae bacterium]